MAGYKGGGWSDERIRVWIRFVLGFVFLGYFCFAEPERLESVPVTFLIATLIFGPAVIKLWKDGGN